MATDNNGKKVRSFFKNNPFFSVDENAETTSQAPQAQPQAQPQVNIYKPTAKIPESTFPVPPPVQVDVSGEVEQQYLDHFMKFLEEKNFPGLDYLEFANTLHKMYEKSGASLAEPNLYQLAFVTFEAQGITADVLVQTAQKYIDLVTAHKKEFEKYQSNDGAKVIQDKTAENDRLTKANASAEQQIAALQQQIQQIQQSTVANSGTIAQNNVLIESETQKLQTKQIKFESAFKVVIAKISGDVEKIKSYLK